MNKVKPTEKQRSTFEHIKRGMKLRDAMLEAGYSKETAQKTKQNFTDRAGVQPLIEQYKKLLIKNGLSLDMLAEIQIEGLFDENGAVRLGYLRETKKDMGLVQDEVPNQTNIQINVHPEFLKKYGKDDI